MGAGLAGGDGRDPRGRRMRRSSAELRAVVERAARGVGADPGRAAELAAAAAYLARSGLDGALAADAALAHEPFASHVAGEGWRAARDAGALWAELVGSDRSAHVAASPVDAPLALLGLMGVAARGAERVVVFEGPGGVVALAGGQGAQALAPLPNNELVCRLADAGAQPPIQTPTSPMDELDQAAWTRLEALAARTFVPATDESRRRGAGGAD